MEENSRDVWRWLSIENFFADVRYGLRMLRRNPVFTAVGMLTIAIGIGANAAVFSVVNSVLLKPLNYPKSEELVALHQIAPGAAGLADFRERPAPLALDVFHVRRAQPDVSIVGRVDTRHRECHRPGRAGTSAHGCRERWRASERSASPRQLGVGSHRRTRFRTVRKG